MGRRRGRLADRVALAWRAPRLVERLRRREVQQRVTAELGRAALAGTPLADLLPQAARSVAAVLDLPVVNILCSIRPDEPFRFAAVHGWDRKLGQAARPCRSPLDRLLRSGTSLVVQDSGELDEPARSHFERLGLRSSALVLTGSPDGTRWVLAAHAGATDAFTDDDTAFLHAVVAVLATAAAREKAMAAREEAAAEAQRRATHDRLTGLPDRELFRERLQKALDARPEHAVLLLLDLDGFKDINDTLGHDVGDEVLDALAGRLRVVAGDGGHVCRLGGDEFALAASEHTGSALLQRLDQALRAPVATSSGPVRLGGSVGSATYPCHGTTVGHLLKYADLALVRAKREHLRAAAYDRALDPDPADRLRLVDDLREAVAHGDITLAYQPSIDYRTGRVTTVEALARWRHPVRGPQNPAEFIELAERTGLIAPLTDHVVATAARQAALWHAEGRGFALAVNVPGTVLAVDGYPDRLREQVIAAGLPLDLLRIEVTETTLVDDRAVHALTELAADGIRIAVDDFGTGYSSLARLKVLPVHTLKIDRSFVTDLQDDPRDRAIVRAVVALAADMNLNVLAEGVETEEVAALLHAMGVHRHQGFLYSRGLPALEFAEWHDRWLVGPAGQRSALTAVR